MSANSDKNIQLAQYIVSFTEKLSKTFKQLNEMSLQFLKTINGVEAQSRCRNSTHRDKQNQKNKLKEKNQDLNSNLIDQDDDDENQFNTKKKLKTKNRIQQAEEQLIEQPPSQEKKTIIKIIKKQEEHPSKPLAQEKSQDKKKITKPVSHKPKAPTSSFLLFFKEQQHSIAKSYPNYGVVQLTKVAAKCWNDLSVEDKEPYQKLFQIERKNYQQEMEKYRRDFPEEVRLKQLEKKEKKKQKAKQRRTKESTATKNQVVKQKTIIASVNNQNYFPQMQQFTPTGVKLQQIVIHDEMHERQNQKLSKIENQESDQFEDEMQECSEQQNSLGQDI